MIPPRGLVTLYVMTAHLSLALAFALTAANPHTVAGFFYHSRMVAIVHLITIGWIALSILGNVYVVAPMTFGVPFPAGKGDYSAFVLLLVGLIGMVSHFWIAEFGGMAWSAAIAAGAACHVALRFALRIRSAKVANGVKLHIYFATGNLVAAVTMGVLLGFDKVHQFLPGYVLSNVFAHAHLAAIGWVSMMVVGIGYRLLPMALPSATPSGRSIFLSAALLQTGIAGLFCTLVVRSNWAVLFAIAIVVGFAVFGAHVLWMFERPKHPPPDRPRVRMTMIHLSASALWLLCACICGVMLAALPMSEFSLRLALLYGTLGLVGFLAQIIVGLEQRILPIAAGYWGLKPVSAGVRSTSASLLWAIGIPAIGLGFFFNRPSILGTGAWLLLTAAIFAGLDVASQLMGTGTDRSAPPQRGGVGSACSS